MAIPRPQPESHSLRSLLTRMPPASPLRLNLAETDAGLLRTPRLRLRPLAPGDRREFVRAIRANRDHLSRSFPLTAPGETDEEAFERHMALSALSGAGAPNWRRAAFDESGRLVGEFNLNAIQRGLEFRAEAAWWVGREFCGRGYATEGVRALLEVAFGDLAGGGLGLHRVDAMVCPENAASLRIVQKLGFVTPRSPVRVSLDIAGEWREHEMFTRYVEAASQIEGKPLSLILPPTLPPIMRRRIDAQVHVLEQADPGLIARAATA